MIPDVANAPKSPRWLERLGHPAIGNICAVLALIVAIAAGIGLLRQTLFWLVFGYVILASGLVVAGLLGRQRDRMLSSLRGERDVLEQSANEAREMLARTVSELGDARDEIDACEAGYADLRAAVVQTAQWGGAPVEDFDDQLADALRKLSRPRVS